MYDSHGQGNLDETPRAHASIVNIQWAFETTGASLQKWCTGTVQPLLNGHPQGN